MREYKIVPPKNTNENMFPVDPLLMELNFRMLMVASSKSGKGVALNNLLSEKFPYLKIFGKNIFLFSTSYSLGDPSLTNLQKYLPEENCFDTLDLQVLKELLHEQKRHILQFGKENCVPLLIIFDDILTSVNNTKTNDIVREIWFSGRHYLINTIMCIQMFRGISKAVRVNSTHILLWNIENSIERKTLIEEMPCESKLFLKILDHATDEAFSFLKVNLKERDKNKRFQLRFTDQYYQLE